MTEVELKADNEAFRERIRIACEMLMAKGDLDVFNALTGNGAHVPKVRRDVLDDNERLRGLIKGAERQGASPYSVSDNCPWCGYHPGEFRRKHAPECPAFTENGEVK